MVRHGVVSFVRRRVVNLVRRQVVNLTDFSSKVQNRRGIIFCFWNNFFNEYNTTYRGYAFRNFSIDSARLLMSELSKVIDEKTETMTSPSKNVIFKYDDLTFILNRDDTNTRIIRVLWKGFDASWNQDNYSATKRRFNRFFDLPKK